MKKSDPPSVVCLRKILFLLLSFLPLTSFAITPDELEEPGFSFLVGNPYTEEKKFMSLNLSDFYVDNHHSGQKQRSFVNNVALAYGFTDRLEASLALQYDLQWNTSTSGQDSFANGFDDTILGLRYRFLTQQKNPVALAFGPQLWLPTGDFTKGFGLGSLSLAWDLTLGREWNKLFFTTFNLNYATTFSAPSQNTASTDHFTLHDFFYGLCLGFRPLERDDAKGGHHDIHVTLELSGNLGQQGHAKTTTRFTQTQDTYLIIPGIKYGYSSKGKLFTEVGLGGILGLGSNSPDWGLVLQTQWEFGI